MMANGLLAMNRRAMPGASAAAAAVPAMPAYAKGPRYPAMQALIDGYVAAGLVPGAVVGVVQPGRHQPMQRLHRAVRIPPCLRHGREAVDLVGVDCGCHLRHPKVDMPRAVSRAALAARPAPN